MAMNISMLWPIVLIVISSVCYQICAKSSPSFMHPLAVLVIAYAVGAVGCAILYMVLNRGGNLLAEIKSSNKIPYLIGICLIGLEWEPFICTRSAGLSIPAILCTVP